MTHCSRKRPRCDDDCCELMPISKRINDLHIRSSLAAPNVPLNNPVPDMHSRTRNVREGFNGIGMPEVQRQVAVVPGANNMMNYRPELNATQNPYYYHVNGILYEAHALRMQRLIK